MKKLTLALLPLALALLGCQSYQDGLAAICNAPSTCGKPCQEVSPDLRVEMVSRHINDSVGNGEAKALYLSLAGMAPEQRAVLLKQEAAKNGLSGCPLADMFASPRQQ